MRVATIDIARLRRIPYLSFPKANVIVPYTLWQCRSPIRNPESYSGIFALARIRNVDGPRAHARWPDHQAT